MTISLAYDSQLSRVRASGTVADVLNAGFETDVTGWEAVGGTLARSTLQFKTGVASAFLDAAGGVSINRVRTTVTGSPVVKAGETYELSAWVRSPTGREVDISAAYWDANNVSIDFVIWTSITVPANTWTKITGSRVAPTGAVKAELNINQRNTPVAADDLYVDDVRFRVTGVLVERSTDQIKWKTVRGGSGVLANSSAAWTLDDYEFEPGVANYYRARGETASLTPTLSRVWLKSIARPFLNREVTVVDYSDVERAARGGVFDIVGRSLPISVSDVRVGRSYTLEVLTTTADEERNLDLFLASGDPVFVHVPGSSMVPGGYYTIGDTSARRHSRTSLKRVFALPLREIAAPGPDVVGAASTYQTVLDNYATYQAVVNAHATYESILTLIGSPTEVIVG